MEEPTIYEDGVVSNLIGGLGNNLFIAVAGWIASQRIECPHYIFKYTTNEHNWKHHDYTQTILKYLGTCLPQEQEEGLATMRKQGYTSRPLVCPFEYNIDDIHTKQILEGYFQTYSYIQFHEQDIRKNMLQGLEPIREAMRKEFPSVDWTTSVFVHVRRGDYLKNPHIHTIQPIGYYETALQHCAHASDIFLFSDDMEWVKQQKFFHSFDNVYFIEKNDELECLALMSLCGGGAVCANSTFSWWGAFLGAYARRSPVCVPRDWIHVPPYDSSVLIPSDWIRI